MLVPVKTVAQMLYLSEKEIHRLIKQSGIPYHRINDQYLFSRTEILEWATVRRMRVSPRFFAEDSGAGMSLPSLLEAVRAGGFLYGIQGTDQATVLRSIVGQIRLPDGCDRDFLYEVLLARESMGSTGVGNGIAIPHVRNPVVLQVAGPSVSVCFLHDPIDFNAVDGKPVDILFTLISPTVQSHLHLLSRIGFVLHNADFRAGLVRRAPAAELFGLLEKAEVEIPVSGTGAR